MTSVGRPKAGTAGIPRERPGMETQGKRAAAMDDAETSRNGQEKGRSGQEAAPARQAAQTVTGRKQGQGPGGQPVNRNEKARTYTPEEE